MRVLVDQGACIGAGNCVLSAPEVFDQGDDGLVVLLDGEPPGTLEEDVRLAALRCPARAITVSDR
jgi:ferredoxin